MTNTDCIFCKIIAGEIPSFKLYEDDRTYAMMDINPFHDGHCLVLTKAHCVNILDADAADLAAVLPTAQKISRAVEAALEPEGINLIQANGPAAGQTVYHYHTHIFPRRLNDGALLNWGHAPGDMGRIEDVYKKIMAALD
ncbi:MAG: HIT family protein [Rhodospirillaceae bacterium]|jgi:histidine triad (HIT) family protein|nr:HIT family protein [Rhodospirillaceae bacterium]MBT4486705.1 HIT family protein [Rhodospirillaceae bacterium]MBT5195012.1 HIT family protein [Rhodospirillaceae bacterium]MBT5894712.1 HIT family protein [Rhodospirillaceae bacterium]MBT6429117.1 HIT family protein [Rhodospirillaceae bacterium]